MVESTLITGRPLVHLISGLAAGGAESFLLRLLSADATLRDASRIISIRQNDDLSAQFEKLGVPVLFLPLGLRADTLSSLWRLIRELSSPRVELVQSWLYLADAVAAVVAHGWLGKTVVWGIRSSHGGGKRATRFIAQGLNPWLSRHQVDAIVVCGERAREAHLAFGYAASRMQVIPNGFDFLAWRHDSAAGRAIRDAFGIAEGDFVVGMVARAEIYKDHAALFEAIAKLRPSIPGLRLLLCGNGITQSNAPLMALARQQGIADIVYPLGLRRDLSAVYSALDLHVLASRSEGFPNVVAEAILCDCASVCTDVGEAAEIISDRRWIVPVGSVEALAQTIAAFHALTPPQRDDVRQHNAEWVRERFAMEKTAARYISLYRSLAPSVLKFTP